MDLNSRIDSWFNITSIRQRVAAVTYASSEFNSSIALQFSVCNQAV